MRSHHCLLADTHQYLMPMGKIKLHKSNWDWRGGGVGAGEEGAGRVGLVAGGKE